jgi:FixJ family two-component response regulator
MNAGKKIAIVDDDKSVRDSIAVVLRLNGVAVPEFEGAAQLLACADLRQFDCLLLDLRMDGMDGLALLAALNARDIVASAIIMTAFGDVPSAVRALRLGAFDFLEKPIYEDQLIRSVGAAVAHAERAATARAERLHVEKLLHALTPREKQILDAVLDGRHNREIAAEFKLSVRTVEVYKARVMEKMEVSRVTELVRLVMRVPPDGGVEHATNQNPSSA